MGPFIVNVGRIDNDTIMVEFSDDSFATFTVTELVAAKTSLRRPDPITAPHLIN